MGISNLGTCRFVLLLFWAGISKLFGTNLCLPQPPPVPRTQHTGLRHRQLTNHQRTRHSQGSLSAQCRRRLVSSSPPRSPPAERAIFLESSFFSRKGPGAELPSPTDVRARSAIQNPGAQQRTYRIPPVRYEELGLIVKFGRAPRVTVDEGQCLWALRRALPEVPVPEVYGWTHDGDQVFIFMELVQGVSLDQRWESLSEVEREGVCQELRAMLSEPRRVRHAPSESLLGMTLPNKPTDGRNLYLLVATVMKGCLNYQPPSDIIFESARNNPPGGPFHSVVEFHDWLSILIRTGLEQHWPGLKAVGNPRPRPGVPAR